MRKPIWLVLGLLLLTDASAASFVMNELPDFSDTQQWRFVGTMPLVASVRGRPYVWGTIKTYRLRQNEDIVGFEEYAFASKDPYFKTWGREAERPFYALRDSDLGTWLVGPPGGSWWEARLDVDPGGKVRGVWVVLFVRPTGKASGRYMADPAYQAPPPVRQEEVRI